MATYKLVIDKATDRIIWYNVGQDITPYTDERSVLVTYEGELPSHMFRNNCWSFTYRDGQIVQDTYRPTEESNLALNRGRVRDELTKAIYNHRANVFPDPTSVVVWGELLTEVSQLADETIALNQCKRLAAFQARENIPLVDQALSEITKRAKQMEDVLDRTEQALTLVSRINNCESVADIIELRKQAYNLLY